MFVNRTKDYLPKLILFFFLSPHLISFHKLLAVWGGLSSASAHNLVLRLHNFFWNFKKGPFYVNQGAHIDNVDSIYGLDVKANKGMSTEQVDIYTYQVVYL